MARMHARKKGRSGSTKPTRSNASSWMRHKPDVVEKLVVKFGKEDMTPAMIGTILRDQYGIPAVRDATGKKISKILAENKLSKQLPHDLLDLMKRAVNLRKHLETNRKDKHSTRGLNLIEAKIKRLTRYYQKVGKVDAKWRYNPEEAKIIIS